MSEIKIEAHIPTGFEYQYWIGVFQIKDWIKNGINENIDDNYLIQELNRNDYGVFGDIFVSEPRLNKYFQIKHALGLAVFDENTILDENVKGKHNNLYVGDLMDSFCKIKERNGVKPFEIIILTNRIFSESMIQIVKKKNPEYQRFIDLIKSKLTCYQDQEIQDFLMHLKIINCPHNMFAMRSICLTELRNYKSSLDNYAFDLYSYMQRSRTEKNPEFKVRYSVIQEEITNLAAKRLPTIEFDPTPFFWDYFATFRLFIDYSKIVQTYFQDEKEPLFLQVMNIKLDTEPRSKFQKFSQFLNSEINQLSLELNYTKSFTALSLEHNAEKFRESRSSNTIVINPKNRKSFSDEPIKLIFLGEFEFVIEYFIKHCLDEIKANNNAIENLRKAVGITQSVMEILDSPSEEGSDRLAELATQLKKCEDEFDEIRMFYHKHSSPDLKRCLKIIKHWFHGTDISY